MGAWANRKTLLFVGAFTMTLLWAGMPVEGQDEEDFWPVEEEEEPPLNTKPEPDHNLLKQGRRIYERRCIFCHGGSGQGDGPVSRGIFPKPRDFTRGIFKIRSTPSGSPTDEDLFETLDRGLPGTMMPSFSNLRPRQIWSLVYYVKSFYTEPDRQSPEVIEIAEDQKPSPTAESVALGRGLFLDLGCSLCHGLWGNADGPASRTMEDSWGYPITVANLNRPELLRGGHSDRELYRAIATGIGGTPMAAFGDALSAEDIWHLVNYLRSRMAE
jgi:mono/diheme cytochrome c family protein